MSLHQAHCNFSEAISYTYVENFKHAAESLHMVTSKPPLTPFTSFQHLLLIILCQFNLQQGEEVQVIIWPDTLNIDATTKQLRITKMTNMS